MDYIRVTDITEYLFCPRKIYLKYVKNIKEPQSKEKLLGNIIHETLEKINDAEQNIIYSIKDFIEFNELIKIYENELNKIIDSVIERYRTDIINFNMKEDEIRIKILKNVYQEIENRSKIIYETMNEKNLYGIELFYSLDPKVYSEHDIYSSRYNLKGKVDRLEVYMANKIVIPYEFKTGRFDKNHELQLFAYYLILKDEYKNYRVNKGYIIYTKDNKLKEVNFERKDKREKINFILNIRDKIFDIVENKKDPGLNKDKSICQKCAFFKICYKS